MAYISYVDSYYYHNVYNGYRIPEENGIKTFEIKEHIDALTHTELQEGYLMY